MFYLFISYDDESGDGYRGELHEYASQESAEEGLNHFSHLYRIVSANIIEGCSVQNYSY